MTKKRTPTLCEWALGFTVEDYMDNKDRRKSGSKKNGSRFKLEVSTDEESGEDSLKITYPRGENSKGPKKVRFEKGSPKSALKKSSTDTETSECTNATTETETTASEADKSSGSCCSSSSGSSSSKRRSKKHLASSDSSDAESSAKGKEKKKKKSKSVVVDSDTSSSEEDDTRKKAADKTKKGKVSPQSKKSKKQKQKDKSQESDNDAEDESSSDEETSRKAKKEKGDKDKKKKTKAESPKAGNNVGPGKNKQEKSDSPEKSSDSKKKRSKYQALDKLLPEKLPYLGPLHPNLLMPVRAHVLQVEHAIETKDDPRPNAFHDGHHGVVRVYHGPAYGNPNGTLYPIRNPTQATLPVGVPHPAKNSYFSGFGNDGQPVAAPVQDQSSWETFAATLPGGSSMPNNAPSPPMPGALPTGPPNTSPPLPGVGNAAASQGWGQPINVNMYSYGGPMAWGRQRSGNKDSRSVAEIMSGSCENNAGPAMYDREAHRKRDGQGSHQGSNRGGPTKTSHRDLQWSPKLGQAQNATGEWVTQQSNVGWQGVGFDGQNSVKSNSNSNNNNNNDGWGGGGSNNGNNDNGAGENNGNNNAWGNAWENTNGNGSNGSNRSKGSNNSPNNSNNSNRSQKSNRSNNSRRSNQAPAADATNWGGGENNVGFSSGGSNTSKDSKGNRKDKSADAGAADFDNNLGPTQSAGDGWSNDDALKNEQGSGDPSNNMPGAWDKDNQGGGENATFVPSAPAENNSAFPWGDSSAAQGDNSGW